MVILSATIAKSIREITWSLQQNLRKGTAPDALFMGTGSKTLVVKPEEIRSYFENALLNNRPRGASLGTHEARVLSDTAVLFTGLDAVTGVRDGAPYSNPGRVTFVIAKQGPDWKIVHFHRSAMPRRCRR